MGGSVVAVVSVMVTVGVPVAVIVWAWVVMVIRPLIRLETRLRRMVEVRPNLRPEGPARVPSEGSDR